MTCEPIAVRRPSLIFCQRDKGVRIMLGERKPRENNQNRYCTNRLWRGAETRRVVGSSRLQTSHVEYGLREKRTTHSLSRFAEISREILSTIPRYSTRQNIIISSSGEVYVFISLFFLAKRNYTFFTEDFSVVLGARTRNAHCLNAFKVFPFNHYFIIIIIFFFRNALKVELFSIRCHCCCCS
jgi:hypothetical protein